MESYSFMEFGVLASTGQGEKSLARLPIVLDIEASGFGRGSYPIEVGVALADGTTYSWLIKPLIHWTHWREEAEQIHGISRQQLQAEGHSVIDVALALNELLTGETVFCDGWGVDSSWLSLLFYEAGIRQRFRLQSVYQLLDEQETEFWTQCRSLLSEEQGIGLHRAAVDAKLTQDTYQRIIQTDFSDV